MLNSHKQLVHTGQQVTSLLSANPTSSKILSVYSTTCFVQNFISEWKRKKY